MAGNIVDYLKTYGNVTMEEEPFHDVDSLVLCQLAYLKFDGLVPGPAQKLRSVSLQEIAKHADYEKLYADERYEKDNRALFEALLASRRFRKMRLNNYINIIETEWETQFSAVSFLMEDGTLYIAYRGTDETIVGWKEDFNMAFLSPVPGQEYSVKYLNMVTGKLNRPFYIGGHSKGGNLAMYAAMNCTPQVRKRIIKIYSMDGPGFRPEVLKNCDFESIRDRTVKILPHSSLVGMLFEKDVHYQVVESRTFGLAQHNPYTWIVENGHFKLVEDIYESRRLQDDAVNEWVLSLDENQIRTFVDTFYQVITASQADNLIDLTADWKKSMNGIIGALKEVDEETRAMLMEIIKSFFEIAGLRVKQMLQEKASKIAGPKHGDKKKTASDQ